MPLLFFCLIILSACNPTHAPKRFEGIAMTMAYCVQIGDPHFNEDKIQTIIISTFTEVNEIYNNWNPQSEVSQLNLLEANQKKNISPSLSCFLKKIDHLVQYTEGRFDPTVGPIKNALLAGRLQNTTEAIGWDKVHLEGDCFWKESAETLLDFGGAAKGYAVDLLIERLKEAGYHHIYVEWGGEIRTTGSHPEKRPWTIAIRGGDIIELSDKAIATSGSYFQNWEIDQITYTHVIDPKIQSPLSNSPITSASVLCETCFEADALATAFMLFPSIEEANAWAQARDLKIFLF